MLDHHVAPGDIAGGFQIVYQAAIVGAIEARLHDSEMFEFQHPHHIFELLQRGVGHGVEGLFDRWINVQRAKNVNMCVDRAGRHFERGTFQRVRWTGWVSNQWIGYICGKLRSEEHTSELQSLMRISYAVFCLKKKKQIDRRTKIAKQ